MRTDPGRSRRAARLGLFLLSAALTGCGSDSTGTSAFAISSVVVAAPRSTVGVGKTVQLSAVALNRSGVPVPGATYVWTSSNASVATVSQQGLVTGVALGVTTITATSGTVAGTLELSVAAGGVTNFVPG